MTGKIETYVVADGGHGAAVLASLRHARPGLTPAASPRHADVLIVVEPVTTKFAPAVAEVYRSLPAPRRVLAIAAAVPAALYRGDGVGIGEVISGAPRIVGTPSAETVLATAVDLDSGAAAASPGTPPEAVTVPLPSKSEREIATELAVLTLGPAQHVTAGPLRVLLVCDGEQVVSATTDRGYAARNVAGAMTRATWAEALDLAGVLDPLAPLAGRLAYLTAVERLQGIEPSAATREARDAALALERAVNALQWLERFFLLLDHAELARRAGHLALELAGPTTRGTPPLAAGSVLPDGPSPAAPAATPVRLAEVADGAEQLARRLRRDPFLAWRTRGVGTIDANQARAAGVDATLVGDVRSRMLSRADRAAGDLRLASRHRPAGAESPASSLSAVPRGEIRTVIAGPRGSLGLRLASDGAERPARIEWERPSAAALTLVPALLAGQKLADAEVIVASLDLAMAEADG